jgi:hypothetical protein
VLCGLGGRLQIVHDGQCHVVTSRTDESLDRLIKTQRMERPAARLLPLRQETLLRLVLLEQIAEGFLN